MTTAATPEPDAELSAAPPADGMDVCPRCCGRGLAAQPIETPMADTERRDLDGRLSLAIRNAISTSERCPLFFETDGCDGLEGCDRCAEIFAKEVLPWLRGAMRAHRKAIAAAAQRAATT